MTEILIIVAIVVGLPSYFFGFVATGAFIDRNQIGPEGVRARAGTVWAALFWPVSLPIAIIMWYQEEIRKG